ncbi:MAG: NAD(P)-dependent oxidoreductase [Desulfobacterales bacterium]|nr:NAD(P)-dependent oxidoreductase [Desulfobacterales bacterium]
MNQKPPTGSLYKHHRVLVTGASGFIGGWVARALLEGGARPWLAVRDLERGERGRGAFSAGIRAIQVDLEDFDACREMIARVRPDIVFNMAGYGVDPSESDEETAWRVNDELVGVLAETLHSIRRPVWGGPRLVHAGSGFEYGPAEEIITEQTREKPNALYGRSKLAGTTRLRTFCRDHGFPAVIARLFTIYGRGEHPRRLLPSLLHASKTGRPLALTGGAQARDFTYVADAAEGLLRLGATPRLNSPVVNLATGRLLSVKDFVLTAARVLKIPPHHLQFGKIPIREDEPVQPPVSIDYLQGLLGWRPTTTAAQGVEKTLEFAHGEA